MYGLEHLLELAIRLLDVEGVLMNGETSHRPEFHFLSLLSLGSHCGLPGPFSIGGGLDCRVDILDDLRIVMAGRTCTRAEVR